MQDTKNFLSVCSLIAVFTLENMYGCETNRGCTLNLKPRIIEGGLTFDLIPNTKFLKNLVVKHLNLV